MMTINHKLQNSVANTLREAAVTWPLDLQSSDLICLNAFLLLGEWDAAGIFDRKYRTFMLLVACALDGGREPMSAKAAVTMADSWYESDSYVSSLIRTVERYHGIGVQG